MFENMELDTSRPVVDFKRKLEEVTGVPVARQKLMAKGGWKGILKDDQDLSAVNLKSGMNVMLMGSAELVVKPKEQAVFVEDMKDEELAQSGHTLPAGLMNLGNTCYMNSTLQCFRKVPELRASLNAYRPTGTVSRPEAAFTASFGDVLSQLDRSTDAIPPHMFISAMQTLYPQFAQRDPRGAFMQQDAEELYSAIQSTLSNNLREASAFSVKKGDEVVYLSTDDAGKKKRLPAQVVAVHPPGEPGAEPYFTVTVDGKEKQTVASRLEHPGILTDLGGAQNSVDALFGIEMEETLTCEESKEEAPKVSSDLARKLVCNIEIGTAHLAEGVKIGLKGQIEKHSDVLGRNAVWTKSLAVKRLPRYICVQFMRFFWKATPNSADHAGVKCKIMRPVSFPDVLDAYEFCSDDLKKILDVPRSEIEKEILGGDRAEGSSPPPPGGGGEEATAGEEGKDPAPVSNEDPMELEGEDAAALEAALAMSVEPTSSAVAGPGLPPDFTGKYELFGVVTHKGREADGGHYIGWVREEPGSDSWLKYDDDVVSPVKTEDIMALKGGGVSP